MWPQGADIQDRVNNRSVDVVDVAAGSSGALATPDNYQRSDSPVGRHRAADLRAAGTAGAGPRTPRAFALCTPRDAIAHDAGVPIANSRLDPATEDAVAQGDGAAEAGPFGKADPDAARDALAGAPLTVRIGYQGPNARLAATVGTIAKSCAPAGITVTGCRPGQQGLVGPAGAAGREDRRAAGQHRRGHRQRIERIVGDGRLRPAQRQRQQPVRLRERRRSTASSARWRCPADPAERVRLLAEGAPVLWGDMPTLPLYRQQRTLLMSKKMYAVSSNPTRWGAGWNMDRWALVQ